MEEKMAALPEGHSLPTPEQVAKILINVPGKYREWLCKYSDVSNFAKSCILIANKQMRMKELIERIVQDYDQWIEEQAMFLEEYKETFTSFKIGEEVSCKPDMPYDWPSRKVIIVDILPEIPYKYDVPAVITIESNEVKYAYFRAEWLVANK